MTGVLGDQLSLSGLTANALSEIYCLAVSRLLVHWAIDKLPVRVPDCYEKLQILSEPTLKFFKSDYRKAGTVAKVIQSRLAPLPIGKNDAMITLNNKRGRQQSSSCHKDTAGVSIHNTESRKVSVSRAKQCSKDSNKQGSFRYL